MQSVFGRASFKERIIPNDLAELVCAAQDDGNLITETLVDSRGEVSGKFCRNRSGSGKNDVTAMDVGLYVCASSGGEDSG